MITVVISDLHLTDKFEKDKFVYVKRIISQADKVIINGDFWDGYLTTFEQFISSRWQKLFPILKAKDTAYIYGNHDKKKMCGKKVSLFSQKQKEKTSLSVGIRTLHIEHGHKIAPAAEERFPWKFLPITKQTTSLFLFARETFPLFLLGKSMLGSYKSQNEKMKKWAGKNLAKSQILVSGHSHLLEFNLDKNYINTGFIRYGYGQYLKINGNNMELVDERY